MSAATITAPSLSAGTTDAEAILPGYRFDAAVETVLVADGKGFETHAVEALELGYDGISGDFHFGPTRRSGGREPWYPRRTEMRNERQVSIVARDELAAIAELMEIDRILPEWIGANLVLSGIPELSWLPPGTRLFFAGGATLTIESQNGPCRLAGAGIAPHFPERTGLDLLFPQKGKHRRGVVAWVEKTGTIRPGEAVTVKVPVQRLYGHGR